MPSRAAARPADRATTYSRPAKSLLSLNIQSRDWHVTVRGPLSRFMGSSLHNMYGWMALNMGSPLTADDLQIITRIALFRGLKPETVEHIVAPANVVTLKARSTLFLQAAPASAFFIMIDGWTKHYRLNQSGEEAVIHVFTRGDSFAEAAALTGAPFPATAEAVTDVRVVRVPANHIVSCIREDPSVALAMIASMSQRLHQLMQHVEQLKAQTGVQRVAGFLASLAPVDRGRCVIALPYDKGLIAARLGLRPSSLSRTFAKLRSVGVAVHAAHVDVAEVAKLRRLAKDDKSAVRGAFHDM